MPYLAPDAAMPMTSCAPRFAERKARPVTHAGMERPDEEEVLAALHMARRTQPMPSTKAK